MNLIQTKFQDAVIVESSVYRDGRGFFLESYNEEIFKQQGIRIKFIQDNHSLSSEAGTIRGMHYQLSPKPQTKLVRVTRGAIYDVIVDIRKGSPTFGEWEGYILTEENKRQLLVPRGFAHGFCTLTRNTEVQYKVDNLYSSDLDRGIIWDDPDMGITWPTSNPILSDKDKNHPPLKSAEYNFEWKELSV